MVLQITIPKEFENDFIGDRFEDSLERVARDARSQHNLAGRYDIEVACMLINSLREAEVVLEQEHDQEADNDHEIAD